MVLHRNISCEVSYPDLTPLRAVEQPRQSDDPPDLVRATVQVRRERVFVLSWKAFLPFDATCKVFKCSPARRYVKLVAATHIKREDPTTHNRRSSDHGIARLRTSTNSPQDSVSLGTVRLEIHRVRDGDPYKLVQAELSEHFANPTYRIQVDSPPNPRPFITFQFDLVKDPSTESDNEALDEEHETDSDGDADSNSKVLSKIEGTRRLRRGWNCNLAKYDPGDEVGRKSEENVIRRHQLKSTLESDGRRSFTIRNKPSPSQKWKRIFGKAGSPTITSTSSIPSDSKKKAIAGNSSTALASLEQELAQRSELLKELRLRERLKKMKKKLKMMEEAQHQHGSMS